MTIVNKNELDRIIKLYQSGKTKSALKKGLALKRASASPDISNTLGIIYRSIKQLKSALLEYEIALKAQPQNPTYLNNKANVLRDMGFLKDAAKTYKLALKFNPLNGRYWCNLAKVYNDDLNHHEAEAAAREALKLDPQNVEALNNLGLALEGQSQSLEALKVYQDILRIDPKNAMVHNNLGQVLYGLSRIEAAISHTKQAILLNPNSKESYYNLCEIYDKTNQIAKFEDTLKRLPNIIYKNDSIQLKKGQLEFRMKKYKECIKTLNGIVLKRLPTSKIIILHELLGKCLDHVGRYNEAMLNFSLMNASGMKVAIKANIDTKSYQKNIDRLTQDFKNQTNPRLNKLDIGSEISPAFIIGFPRSGTTLLDTILRSHPSIQVVEELPLIDTVVSTLKKPINPNFLSKLSTYELTKLRHLYETELSKVIPPLTRDKVVIDKFPLNIIHVPLIKAIFPNSKFILVVRHPCDCIFSCFMQNFELNEAMVNFLSLESTVSTYLSVMNLWSLYSQQLAINVELVKYENLISEFKETSTRVLKFLDLEWNDKLFKYYETGRNRNKIMTPSYSQVTETLYKHANGRWKNYSTSFEGTIESLRPWIMRFSYEK